MDNVSILRKRNPGVKDEIQGLEDDVMGLDMWEIHGEDLVKGKIVEVELNKDVPATQINPMLHAANQSRPAGWLAILHYF